MAPRCERGARGAPEVPALGAVEVQSALDSLTGQVALAPLAAQRGDRHWMRGGGGRMGRRKGGRLAARWPLGRWVAVSASANIG